MKIVNIIGGLGNQMFQYALYYALKKHNPEEDIKIFKGAFRGYNKHNCYELDTVFGVTADEASLTDMIRISYPYFSYKLWQIGFHFFPQRNTMIKERIFGRYYQEVFDKQGDCYFDGYWQNEKYFNNYRSELLLAYTPMNIDNQNASFGQMLETINSVSIHVRHGDFSNNPVYKGICDIDYYQHAINKIIQLTDVDLFCIFSNDIQWCRDNIIPRLRNKKYAIIDWNTNEKSFLDIYLMSKCCHNIVANSSFSWWGAWLNQHSNKIVIAPKKWNNLKRSEFELNAQWIKI